MAPWFGLPMCDPNSYPQNPCTPDSDSNVGLNVANAAGSAFMELQLYPPGYTPFVDSESCSATKWCAALTIDSLECNFNFATCNPNCEEPANFAFLQTNGVPAGPPSPQLADASTFLPNRNTLLINQGDVLQISITDPSQGFTTVIRDLTTHQTGYMTASAGNGFMNTNLATCDGTPYTFHAEYNTASVNNRVPWAALEGGVLMEQELGHSEVCSSLANQDPVVDSYADGQSFTDNSVYDTCVGGSEGKGQVGEGPCSATTGLCQNAETQGLNGPVACPTNNPASGVLCEFADGYCFPKGSRTVLINGVSTTASSDANQCFADRFQNGDLDFDGLSYQTVSLAERRTQPPDGIGLHRAVHQREDVPEDPVRDGHCRILGAVRRGHRDGLHRPADQCGLLPVLVAQQELRARVAHDLVRVEHRRPAAEHRRQLRQGCPVRSSRPELVRRHAHQPGPVQSRVRQAVLAVLLAASQVQLSPGVSRQSAGHPGGIPGWIPSGASRRTRRP